MQTKSFILVALLSLALSAFAEESSTGNGEDVKHNNPFDTSRSSIREGFPYLSYLESDETDIRATVGYNRKTTTIINKTRSALPKSHPLYVADEFEADDVLLMETTLGEDGKRYYVLFSSGPSADPEFYIIEPAIPNKYWATLPGNALALPGNNAAYVAGRFNELFTRRSKYLYTTSGLNKIKQPFAYVGLKTSTLTPITIYAASDEKTAVAQLPQGTEIEVLLANEQVEQPRKICLLIKTPLGLVGWAWVPYGQYNATAIDGISFWGD